MIVRQSCLNRAVEIYVDADGGQPTDKVVAQICQLAEKFKSYVYNGLGGMVNPDYEGGDIDPEEEAAKADQSGENDVPF